jgi:hypothetical protein
MKKEKMYIAGSIFEVRFRHNGRVEQEKILLARTFEPNKLFQVITLSGYHAGEIEGYIPYQFNDSRSCSFAYLEQELKIWVYSDLISLKEYKPRIASSVQ